MSTGRQERPYRLEVWEPDPTTHRLCWRVWSTYVAGENAAKRQTLLAGKGYSARVVANDTCPVCHSSHSAPYDGSCLI